MVLRWMNQLDKSKSGLRRARWSGGRWNVG